jgi:hypothetical protein
MVDDELQRLIEQPPDRALDKMESDLWAEIGRREQSQRIARRLLVLQSLVLVAALVGSLVAGQHSRGAQRAAALDAFSPEMPLSASTLLVGSRP